MRPRVNDFTLPVLGIGYIATYAAQQGFNVGVFDAEAIGFGIEETQRIINTVRAPMGGLRSPGADVRVQRAHRFRPGPWHFG